MDNYMIWLLVSVLTYVPLAVKIKRQSSFIALWAFLWGLAGSLALTEWHFHQQWLALVMQEQGDGGRFLHDTTPGHYQSLYGGVLEVVVMLLIPIAWYWVVHRKERIKAQRTMC